MGGWLESQIGFVWDILTMVPASAMQVAAAAAFTMQAGLQECSCGVPWQCCVGLHVNVRGLRAKHGMRGSVWGMADMWVCL